MYQQGSQGVWAGSPVTGSTVTSWCILGSMDVFRDEGCRRRTTGKAVYIRQHGFVPCSQMPYNHLTDTTFPIGVSSMLGVGGS